jgi:signal transduction histidine kinase
MTFRVKDRALTAAVAVAAVVVVLFAMLQYRWSNQVSEATGVRLADTLQLSMINWHLDFLRNFSEVCLTMRVEVENDLESDGSRYAQRLAEWKAVASYPNLVSNVYLLEAGAEPHRHAVRLNPSTRRFEPADPLPDVTRHGLPKPSARSALGRDAGSHMEELHAPPTSQQLAETFIGHAVRGWVFEPSVPALLHPIVREAEVQGDGAPAAPAADWILVELNEAVIRTQILPDLAHRYFQGTDGLDYEVAVVTAATPRQVIYTSDRGFGVDEVSDADGTVDIFGRIGTAGAKSAIQVFHTTSQNRGPGTSAGIQWFPLLRDTPVEQDWRLVVRHRRGGPLGAFVAEMHRRDLVISFGALLLLVASMTMLIITSIRAQRLATLQMDFVTAVSHDLRTPLSVISSAADNIVQGVVTGEDQLKQYGSVISSQVGQLSARVEQILLFAATNNAAQRYCVQPLDVSEIVDVTLASTEGLIRAAQFTVDRQVEQGLPKVSGDLLALSQCLQNLIANALKYGREGAWIGIRARLVESGPGSREVQISVSDRGVGIDSGELPHIFEPFYRSRAVADAQIRGTGLGLTLAGRIAEAMRGRLTVTSELGRGSTFTLHLPVLEPPVADSAREPIQATS